ncbi:transcription antitermination protein NusB domain protein [Dictyocaulus viviparus]|uniref:Transcription antitermination protein NusB domain protein n=1 Tax=Dictyocaulus viviparus TaxID=29172 RepID=A0A0D8XA11_DICVI|nr:transcription antitermination protein NusB domain protein [Dictyocaulus viviparus]
MSRDDNIYSSFTTLLTAYYGHIILLSFYLKVKDGSIGRIAKVEGAQGYGKDMNLFSTYGSFQICSKKKKPIRICIDNALPLEQFLP